MKLPIQAQSVMRTVSPIRVSSGLMSGVTASECNRSACGWAMLQCIPAMAGGPLGVAECLIALGAAGCQNCIPEMFSGTLPTQPGGLKKII